ncbi:hypothetical protein ACKWRH_07640 [Bradyrhizobium sp. Pa8]|uniref:hypothetical protein n=1 Tax=Bradyrhizobium sp. Pa8 TaxID=3386552 RepID=UPI00403F32FC
MLSFASISARSMRGIDHCCTAIETSAAGYVQIRGRFVELGLTGPGKALAWGSQGARNSRCNSTCWLNASELPYNISAAHHLFLYDPENGVRIEQLSSPLQVSNLVERRRQAHQRHQ